MGNYLAITENTLIENTKIGCDLYLKSYVNGLPRYVLFSRGDEVFGNERKKELLGNNIKKLFINSHDLNHFYKYQEKNLKTILDDEHKSSSEKSNVVYSVAKNLTQDLLNDPKSGKNVGRITKWVDNTVSYILHDTNAFSSLLKVTTHDYHTYTHSVNMAVIGLLFGKHLSLNPHELNCLGIGMILHDLGKIEIPLKILTKSGKLTEEEYEVVKKHPDIGMKLLGNKNIEKDSLLIVIQHHENLDGTGYPNRIEGDEIHPLGKISRIIDVYDAITTRTPYSSAKRPFAALLEMKEDMQNCFDKDLFKKFINFLGPVNADKEQKMEYALSNIKI